MSKYLVIQNHRNKVLGNCLIWKNINNWIKKEKQLIHITTIKKGEIEKTIDMIVNESREYNVLLGNLWLKLVKANINYNNGTMNIEYKGQQHTMPITCTQRLDP